VANTMYLLLYAIYGIQKVFAGRTKTARRLHAAHMPVFGPCCPRCF